MEGATEGWLTAVEIHLSVVCVAFLGCFFFGNSIVFGFSALVGTLGSMCFFCFFCLEKQDGKWTALSIVTQV
jgi:hypothetical protein